MIIAYVSMSFRTKEALDRNQKRVVDRELGPLHETRDAAGIYRYTLSAYIEGDTVIETVSNAGILLQKLIGRANPDIRSITSLRTRDMDLTPKGDPIEPASDHLGHRDAGSQSFQSDLGDRRAAD